MDNATRPTKKMVAALILDMYEFMKKHGELLAMDPDELQKNVDELMEEVMPPEIFHQRCLRRRMIDATLQKHELYGESLYGT